MVQLPSPCSSPNTEAFKSGYSTVADTGKERIRRAGAKVKSENALTAPDLDIGFRVLKIDTSNMKDVYYTPDSVRQGDLLAQIDNIPRRPHPRRSSLPGPRRLGRHDHALPIATETNAGKTIFFVDKNAHAANIDPDNTEDHIKELAKRKPLRAVFRDNSFASDNVKINVEQLFKLLSPSTEIRSL